MVITTATSFTGSAINIGKVSSNYFSGQIDEVKIYRKVLTVEQIKKEYNRGACAVIGAATHAGTGAAPKGFWKFDEGSGFSAFDSSGNNNTGILTNMDTTSDWVTGKVGKALDFDGTNDYIATSLTSINPASSAFTASAWVKFNSTSAQQTIIQQRDGSGTGRNLIAFDSSTCGNNKFYSFLGGSCTSTNSTYIDNVWYHVTVTWDLTTLKIYINGNLENSGTPTAESANGEIIIGIGKDLSSSPMNGLIDHVKIYDYVRTPEQIHYDMATGSPIAHFSFDEGYGTTVHNSQEKNGENGLVSWWKFDTASSGTISTAYDEKEVNNGTGYNATYSSTAKIGNSGYFYTGDSTNDYITVTDNDSLDLTTITISAWVRPTDVSGYGTILGKRDSASATTAYALRSNNTQLDFYWKNSGNWQVYTTSDANLVINTWYHIAATYDGTSVKIYKDGVLLTGSCTTGTCNNALEITNDNLGIGWSGEMGSEFWDGYLDSVKLYNRVLSAAEIAADYNSVHGHMINMDPATDWVEGAKQNLQQRVLSKALDFDGSNDRVQIPYSSKLNFSGRAAFSVSAWINPKINNAYGSIVSQSDGSTNTYVMAMNSSGRIEAGRITAATGSTVIPTNKWSHVVFTYDGTYINVYVNAAVDATPTSDINNAGSSDDLLIGAHNYTSPSVFFNGSIDEVKIYNYALTANEVKTEYNRGAAVVLGAGKNEADTAASSLVGWWKMDEGSGFSAFDSSGNNNTGVLTNMDASSDWVAGKVGKALDFDGSNDYISVANSSSINITGSQITVSAWVNFRTANSHDYILEKGQNGGNAQYYFWYAYQWGSCPGGTNNCLISGYYDGSTYRNYMYNWTPLTNRWYHLAWAADGSNVRIYIDGVMISEQTQTGSLQSIAYPLFFGSSRYLINHMDGKIDHVKLFNRALTGAEVAWEYNQGAPIYHWDFNDGQGVIATNAQGKSVPTDGLVGFWTMDSTTVNDMSGNGNHLTNSGSPTSVTGIKGNAVDYASASSQYSYCTDANCGPDLDYQGNGLTLSAWVKADSVVPTSGYRVIMMKHYYTSSTDNGGYYLVAGDGGNPVSQTLRCVLRNSVGSSTQVEVNSGVDMSTSYWQHVVCTYDNNTARIYIDGVLKSSTSYT
ncbi:MAG: LamG domain-containing protein, partial [Chitinophagales bacterium]|nr:LamG domain-containing protein [Chitinophagales bacterium]